ncbi:MAG: hypothetical protein KME26_09630 [Oscillatoria princeps RMCB-10]|nr:hypothetical protein [Oscillatoria princeps RMCB-10]
MSKINIVIVLEYKWRGISGEEKSSSVKNPALCLCCTPAPAAAHYSMIAGNCHPATKLYQVENIGSA